VVSDFPETIQIVGWSDDFGRARPPKGAIKPRVTYGSRHRWPAEVPDSISVEWYADSDPDHRRQQTIFMVGVVPNGVSPRPGGRVERAVCAGGFNPNSPVRRQNRRPGKFSAPILFISPLPMDEGSPLGRQSAV
jgi:hypothetical protein